MFGKYKSLSLNYILEREYHNFSLWYCTSFMSGIIVYFTLDNEPSFIVIFAIFLPALLLILLRQNILWRLVLGLLIAFSIGMLVSKYRTYNIVKNNYHTIFKTDKCITSTINGVIVSIRPTERGVKIILSEVRINSLEQTIPKLSISIPKKYNKEINLNNTISIKANLCKPQNSILPGGYDFSFYSYFNNIIAAGYALSSPKVISNSSLSTSSFIHKIRKYIYDRLTQTLGAVNGNFAAAILLGETKALNKKLMTDIRLSGISHILCVSGLHLSLVAGIFFISFRFILNLSNYLAYNYNIKLISAICSLIGSYCYLELSGMQIAATRAFIMTAIYIYALMNGRSIFPLRSLTIAAFIILSLNPEYIFYSSFQLSFIAVLSLMGGYEFYIKNQWLMGKSKGIFAAIKLYYATNIYSTILAGVVTGPVVINQFYTFATYSVIMNLIAVPIMSFFLMPLSIISVFLMFFGFEYYSLKLMDFFINLIIQSVKFNHTLPLPVWYFGYISSMSILTFLFGFFWFCLWKTNWRFLGIIIILISFVLMSNSPLPNFIIDNNINMIGLKNSDSKLEIHKYSSNDLKPTNSMSSFKRLYWAQWFGQNDAKIFDSKQNIFISGEQKLIVNSNPNQPCENADIYLNLTNDIKCQGNKLTLTTEFLNDKGTMLIFCNQKQCKIRTNNNKRFSL